MLWGCILKMEEEDARHEEQEPRPYVSWTGQRSADKSLDPEAGLGQRLADKSLDPGG